MTLLALSLIQLIHVTLLESPEFCFERCPALNPTTLIPNTSEPPHPYLQRGIRRPDAPFLPHFLNPLNNPNFTQCIDGSSSMTSKGKKKKKKKAGYAIASDTKIIESQPLPLVNSFQKAEYIALTRALTLVANKRANVYTDSKYIFHIIHSHAAIWKK